MRISKWGNIPPASSRQSKISFYVEAIKLLLVLDALKAVMICHQPKHVNRADYLKTFTMLLKVCEQFARHSRYCKAFIAEVKKEVAAAITEATKKDISLIDTCLENSRLSLWSRIWLNESYDTEVSHYLDDVFFAMI